MALVEYSVLNEGLEQIVALLKVISKSISSPSLYPTPELVSVARQLGSTVSLWSIGAYSAIAAYGQHVHVGYYSKINPPRAVLRAAVYPSLTFHYMEAEYLVWAHITRIEREARQRGEGKMARLPGKCCDQLPSTKIQFFS
ncbi:hypothetical protein B0H14DRAFT_2634971 [Mycena olivaceomarginata]|nr:hypothetical protein B0H14DRAFT_2648672 [Mycena olivaceomarginata]KAJ7756916.1 hypothetical protein B0H14DRAFT_2634971 [Mycena olivaceomarginata]